MDRRFGSLSPNVEDRRGEVLSPADQARLIMEAPGVWDGRLVDQMPQAINPLGVQAGMLDMYRPGGLLMLSHALKGGVLPPGTVQPPLGPTAAAGAR